MALSTSTTFSSLFIFLLFTTIAFPSTANANATADEFALIKTTTTNNVIRLRFYFHEVFDTTSLVVARASNSQNNSTFGNLSVFDNILRVGLDSSSTLLGRAQGFDATMMDESITIPLNFVFTAGPYKGSTLALFGRVEASGVAERIVIGGTGQFRGARGYAISKLVRNPTPKYIVVEFNVYVKIDNDFLDEE